MTDRKEAQEALGRLAEHMALANVKPRHEDLATIRAFLAAPTDVPAHNAEALEALEELVALKDIRDAMDDERALYDSEAEEDYRRRKPLAWAAARAALAALAAPTDAEREEFLRELDSIVETTADRESARICGTAARLLRAAPAVPQDANDIADAIEYYWRHHFSDNVDMHPLAAACVFLRHRRA